jgi:peptidoglycan/xylan/chitin deacetylase (PgdA/CDA1 family)
MAEGAQSGPALRRRDLLVSGALAVALGGCATTHDGTSTRESRTVSAASAARSAAPSIRPPAPSQGVDQPDLTHGRRTGAGVALTFHGAGDVAITRTVLQVLAAARARATVFAVGSWLAANPAMARAVLDGGHELGNHTFSHLPMRTLSPARARAEVAQAADVITRLVGDHGSWFRPSGTQYSTPTIRAAARAAGYPRCVSYDVDSLDWTDPGAAAVAAVVLGKASAGSIISMHLGHAGTAAALPHILDGLAARGLRTVTVSDVVR